MKPEKQQLIDDVIEGGSRREATLAAAGGVLRRRRLWRVARQTLALVTLAALLGVMLEQKQPRLQPAPVAARAAAPVAAQALTDEQLLALFPNTPVGLATLPNGKKLLVFPRAADDAKYVTRL